jgi:hypothetical protein
MSVQTTNQGANEMKTANTAKLIESNTFHTVTVGDAVFSGRGVSEYITEIWERGGVVYFATNYIECGELGDLVVGELGWIY